MEEKGDKERGYRGKLEGSKESRKEEKKEERKEEDTS